MREALAMRLPWIARRGAAALGRHYSTPGAVVPKSAPASSGGILSMLGFGGPTSPQVPMTQAIEYDYPTFAAPEVGASAPKMALTTMKNGVRIATENTYAPTTSIGLYVDCGSIYETNMNQGMSHLIESMGFMSTAHRTSFRLVREIEAIGAATAVQAGRDTITYSIEGVRTHIPEMLEILVDSAVNPAFLEWEVAATVDTLKEDYKEYTSNHFAYLNDMVHHVAYRGPLSNLLVAQEGSLDYLSPQAANDFVKAHLVGPNMVLAVSGADHSQVLPIAEQLLGSIPSGPTPEAGPSEYIGGEYQQRMPGNMAHMILAFECPGGWQDVKGTVATVVLQHMLGGGGSFSAGGPGKGMHSRLYRRVLNNYPWVINCTVYSSLFDQTGLLGIHATCAGAKADEMVAIMCAELESIAAGSFEDEELKRAINTTRASLFYNLEGSHIVAEDLGRQLLTYGKHVEAAEYAAMIEKCTKDDIAKLATAMLKTNPTLVSAGDVANMPPSGAVGERFK